MYICYIFLNFEGFTYQLKVIYFASRDQDDLHVDPPLRLDPEI